MFIVHTMEEIQGLLDAHEQFKATLGEADKEYQAIVTLVQQVESIAREHQVPGGLDNPYTSLTAKVDRLDVCQATRVLIRVCIWDFNRSF
jgi:actinin alpha 1/4